jgi:hypothetical protein
MKGKRRGIGEGTLDPCRTDRQATGKQRSVGSGSLVKFGSDKPRPQAYEFGQRTVLRVALRHPARFLELAVSGNLCPTLTELWNQIGARLLADERLSDEGMHTFVHQANDYSVVIVRPPLAEHITEAHFIAVAIVGVRVERYFVLERGWKLDDTPTSWLCELTPAAHICLGEGPFPDDEDGFLKAVLSRLS